MFSQISSTNLFRMYLYYFQFLGLCPTTFNHSTKLNFTILIMISSLHIIVLTSGVIVVYTYSRHIFFDDDIFGQFNDTIKYIGAIIAYYAILIESFLKRDHQSKIWNLLARWHHTERLDGIDQYKLWNSKQFSSCFFGYFALLTLTECYRMPFTLSSDQIFNFWMLYMALLMVSRSRHMQYMLYLNSLHQQIHLLCEELKRIEEYSKYSRKKLNSPTKWAYNRFLCQRLFWAREYYSTIFQISKSLNDAFGWSHLANLTHSFMQLLTDFYWLYWNMDNNTDKRFFGDSSLGVFPSIVIVLLVFGYTTELHIKILVMEFMERMNFVRIYSDWVNVISVKRIGFLVHTIKQIECGPEIRTLMESFSLQLLHEPIIFQAEGCFNLDFSILRDMAAAISTYMVFFIQFTPRYKS